MSLIAGAYSRVRDLPLPDGLEQALTRAVSRRADTPRSTWAWRGVAFVHCEADAAAVPAFVPEGHTAVTAVAGDPLLRHTTGATATPRVDDALRLHAAFRADDLGVLQEATGQFAALHYNRDRHALTLVADRAGFRPLYYWMDDELVVFASALHILRALDVVPKRLSVRGALQLAAFGYIPGTDTQYANIRSVGPGQLLTVEGRASTTQQYWRFDRIPTSTGSADDLADETMRALRRAMARRLGEDKTAVAFLTGGMDTRLVVCELLRQGVRLHTLNGAFTGQQDQVYARLFASAIGATHQEMPGLIADEAYPDRMARTFAASTPRQVMPPDRPHVIWTGVGGSLGIGGVGLDMPMLAALRDGHMRESVAHLVATEGYGLPRRILTTATRWRFADVIEEGLLAEFRTYDSDDPGRWPWLFTILNEYRRAYANTVEDIDLHQCEQLVPLCDSDLLTVTASIPTDFLLGHSFYMRLVARTDRRFFAAPWQTYPGHAVCPVPGLPGVPTQWEHGQHGKPLDRRDGLPGRMLTQVFSREFPSGILRRGRLLSAVGLTMLGLRDTRHALKFADTICRLSQTCDAGPAGAWLERERAVSRVRVAPARGVL